MRRSTQEDESGEHHQMSRFVLSGIFCACYEVRFSVAIKPNTRMDDRTPAAKLPRRIIHTWRDFFRVHLSSFCVRKVHSQSGVLFMVTVACQRRPECHVYYKGSILFCSSTISCRKLSFLHSFLSIVFLFYAPHPARWCRSCSNSSFFVARADSGTVPTSLIDGLQNFAPTAVKECDARLVSRS